MVQPHLEVLETGPPLEPLARVPDHPTLLRLPVELVQEFGVTHILVSHLTASDHNREVGHV